MARSFGSGESESRNHHASTERSPLLAQDEHHHLSPHDPAVSPYNLISVRAFRAITVLFLILSIMWWLVLLVAMFVTPPGLHVSNGGWFGFAYTTLATGTLISTLVFYGTPSKTERGMTFGVLFFITVSLIITVSATPIREGELWTGLASLLWTLFVTVWAIICDAVVQYGRDEEQERLTGNQHAHRTAREICSVFSATVVLAIYLAISILFTINLSILARDGSLPAPGKHYKIAGGDYKVHVYCSGPANSSSPTVFLEGGESPVEGRLETWIKNTPGVGRYCYWDRPGFAFSQNAPSPLSAGMAVDALSEALRQADETGPWVLVSHGVGGIYSRIFASRHASDIKGLLLVDTVPESLIDRLGYARWGVYLWARGFIYPLGIDRMVRTIFMGHSRADRVWGRDAFTNGRQLMAKFQENLVAGLSKNELIAAAAILPKEVPIAVVSSGRRTKRDDAWNRGQRKLAELSEKGTWDVVDKAPHEVWADEKGREVLEKRLMGLMLG